MFAITLERVILGVAIGLAAYMFATMTVEPIGSALDPISAVLTGTVEK